MKFMSKLIGWLIVAGGSDEGAMEILNTNKNSFPKQIKLPL